MRRLRGLRAVAALAAVLSGFGAASAAAAERLHPSLEVAEAPLADWVARQDHAPAGSLKDFRITAETAATFRDMLRAMMAGRWPDAVQSGGRIGYGLASIEEGGTWFVVAGDASGRGREPAIVVNTRPTLDLIVGVPHAAHERGTPEQAALLVAKAGARAAILSGAHRCASRSFVACDGRTRVCGARQPYRTSDVAHNPRSLFHLAHEVMAKAWPGAVVVSLHGMRTDKSGVRTSVILSDGTRTPDPRRKSYATRLRYKLAEVFRTPGAVVSCEVTADRRYKPRRLCGTTNVQGRHVNGDRDVCKGGVARGTGRFIHMEQDRSVRRPFERAWVSAGRNTAIDGFLAAVAEVMPKVE
ncbi:MAG: hypothetical protein MI824_02900 [Hyphomicrobiales bacterium]|nr:hypothetical protein [Hyphomicrobiales bacterium]